MKRTDITLKYLSYFGSLSFSLARRMKVGEIMIISCVVISNHDSLIRSVPYFSNAIKYENKISL